MRLSQPITLAILGGISLVSLAACGQKADLKPYEGDPPPTIPVGATTPPTTEELTTPSAQAKPTRGDELLKRSEERAPDDFDLPPQ